MTLKNDAKFEEKLIRCFKNGKNLVKLDLGTGNSKKFPLICSFCTKYITFDLKKYRRVVFHDTKE